MPRDVTDRVRDETRRLHRRMQRQVFASAGREIYGDLLNLCI
ncbi:hypothetical protein [Defluviimonas sp. SAOS-178_SWC]